MILNALCNLDVEADEGQADAVRHADGRQEPDLGRRGALVLDVADDLLRRLALVALALHPLVEPGLLQGAVEEDEELDVAVEAGLGQGRQVAQHVVPLPAAHPVRVEAAVEPVQAVVGVDEEAQRGLGGPLAAPTHEAAPRQLLQLDGHHGAGAVLLDVVLETLHSHGEDRAAAAGGRAGARRRRRRRRREGVRCSRLSAPPEPPPGEGNPSSLRAHQILDACGKPWQLMIRLPF